jgi:hypothetical protein
MAQVADNVLKIYLPKYHDGDEPLSHIQQLTKACVANGENIDFHKLQYFPNILRKRAVNLFVWFETTNLVTTWLVVQQAFILHFSETCNKGQKIVAIRNIKQRRHETIEDYYVRFFQLVAVISN